MPCTSAVFASTSIAITPSSPDTSRPGASVAARGRKRFVVFFASRTGAPAGIAVYDDRSRPTATSCADQPRKLTQQNLLLSGVGHVSDPGQVESVSANHPSRVKELSVSEIAPFASPR